MFGLRDQVDGFPKPLIDLKANFGVDMAQPLAQVIFRFANFVQNQGKSSSSSFHSNSKHQCGILS